MILVQNIIDNYIFLSDDFSGFGLHILGVGNFFLHILIALGIFVVSYLFGCKIRQLFFLENKKYTFFIDIALGYIIIGTGIGWLGIFSLLNSKIIAGYLAMICLVALYPYYFNFNKTKHLWSIHALLKTFNIKEKVIWGVLLFILIGFLRLMTPEITEDGYHTDLPRLYLFLGTTIHETKELLHVIPYSQLPEMIYLIPIFLGHKEAARFIHFGFYITIILLLFAIAKNKEYSFAKFTPIIFVTTPLVIRYSPSQYTDFFMLLTFLLSVILIEKNMSRKNLILSGIFFGAVLSAKMWMLVYSPVVLLYLALLHINSKFLNILKLIILFVSSSLFVVALWYIRAYIITGNPIYPIFSKLEYLGIEQITNSSLYSHLGLNIELLNPSSLIVFSPLFFLGIVFCILHYKEFIRKVKYSPLFIIFILLTLIEVFVKIYLGRYLLSWYIIFSIVVSLGISIVIVRNIIAKYCFVVFYLILFSYYFLSTIFILPYGLGWADRNKYLTRVLSRDNASYYDFDYRFDKWISSKDLVAVDGIVSFYYADFSYIDIGYIFGKNKKSFGLLNKNNVTKLLIKGGDVEWFCKRLALTDCREDRTKLLASYPPDVKKYNLYSIEK